MPRPLRIEYENAYYHVMNRGRSRQKIFHDERYFGAFLSTLEEAHQRFGLQVLCYCLMSNHYHLLVKTPEANLGRVMRHINGVYTQRYNRLKKSDGPLFRGRYKAISVEEDSYQLQLSRYIHRNPVDAGMVKQPEDYPWSSYPFYIKNIKIPGWLYPQEIYKQLNCKSRFREKYRAFVVLGVDEEMAMFYKKGNQAPYLGSELFRDWIYKQRATDELAIAKESLQFFRPGIDEIIESVAKAFKVSKDSIINNQRGRAHNNIPRWVSMTLAQECGGLKLVDIAAALGLKRTGSIPTTIKKLKDLLDQDRSLLRKVERIKGRYDT
ncbi:MAG TPA: hypothetical protein ENG80_04725 [Nitrospirae bacterium]|nr:hypothetical protein [Nitrospirota bacterium]